MRRSFLRWTDAHRRLVVSVVGVVVVVALAFLGWSIATALENASLATCDRLNLLRQEANLTTAVSYQALSASIKDTPRYVNALPPKLRSTVLDGALRSRRELASLRVTGVTDCRDAVHHPTHYEPPYPQPIGDDSGIHPNAQRILNLANYVLNAKHPVDAMRKFDHSL